ncbi:unnamed protein product [Lathyrus oleraceus]
MDRWIKFRQYTLKVGRNYNENNTEIQESQWQYRNKTKPSNYLLVSIITKWYYCEGVFSTRTNTLAHFSFSFFLSFFGSPFINSKPYQVLEVEHCLFGIVNGVIGIGQSECEGCSFWRGFMLCWV